MPKISIITPCYNAAAFIGAQIQSIKAQSLGDFEHIIVDDGSTDDSPEIVARHIEGDARFRLVRQDNQGAIRARLRGYDLSSRNSSYLYFFDADDLMLPSMLERMVGYLDPRPHVGMAFCDTRHIDVEGNQVAKRDLKRYVPTRFGVRALDRDEPNTPFVSVLCWAPILEAVAVMRRHAYELAGGWDPDFGQLGEGADLFSRIALHFEVHYVDEVLHLYRQHPDQVTSREGVWAAREEALLSKWASLKGIPEEHGPLVRDVLQYQKLRLAAYLGFKAGVESLKNRDLLRATRFIGGAAIRYARSLGTGIDYRALNERGGRARSGKV